MFHHIGALYSPPSSTVNCMCNVTLKRTRGFKCSQKLQSMILGDLFQRYSIYRPKIIVCVTRRSCVLNKGTATGGGRRIIPSAQLVWCQTLWEVIRSCRTSSAGAGPFLMQSHNLQNHTMSRLGRESQRSWPCTGQPQDSHSVPEHCTNTS